MRDALGTRVHLKTDQSARVDGIDDVLTIKNNGYGHKITYQKGDLAFVDFDLTDKAGSSTLRFYRSDKFPQTKQWKAWSITVIYCGDIGPPHDPEAITEIVIKQ